MFSPPLEIGYGAAQLGAAVSADKGMPRFGAPISSRELTGAPNRGTPVC